MPKRRLTPEQQAVITDLYNKGEMTTPQIAKAIDQPISTVRGFIRRRKLTNRRDGDELKRRLSMVRDLHSQGLNDSQIAQRIARNVEHVRYLRCRFLKLKPNPMPREVSKRPRKHVVRSNGRKTEWRWEMDKYDAFLDGAPIGLTTHQWKALKIIREAKEMTFRELADAMGCSMFCAYNVGQILREETYVEIVGKGSQHRIIKSIPWSPHLKQKKPVYGTETEGDFEHGVDEKKHTHKSRPDPLGRRSYTARAMETPSAHFPADDDRGQGIEHRKAV